MPDDDSNSTANSNLGSTTAQSSEDLDPSLTAEISPDNDPNHSRNFGLGVLYMVLMRVGWIFKTESIIMPAVVDAIGGAGWLRGCLPMLNRFGQSLSLIHI